MDFLELSLRNQRLFLHLLLTMIIPRRLTSTLCCFLLVYLFLRIYFFDVEFAHGKSGGLTWAVFLGFGWSGHEGLLLLLVIGFIIRISVVTLRLI